MRRLSLLLVAFMVPLVSGCATASRQSGYSADQLKALGEKAIMAHETATSLKFLTEAAEKRPHDASIQYDLALAYNQRGFEQEAIGHMLAALQLKPVYPEASNALGAMYAATRQFDLAKGAFEKALRDPFYQTPQIAALNLGELYQKRGDSARALSYYRQAVKLSPNYARAWYRIGLILEDSDKKEDARLAYETAVRESPDLAEAHLRLGIMSYRAGELKDAAGSFGLVERLAPANSEAGDLARKYLEKINNPGPPLPPSRYHPSSPPKTENTEPVKKNDPTASSAEAHRPIVVKGAIAPEMPASPLTGYMTEPPVPSSRCGSDGPSSALIPPSCNTGGLRGSRTAARDQGRQEYIVKIAAYPDRAKAESIRSRLRQNGFDAIIRQDHEHAFEVQLKAVDSYAKAAVLMSRLTGQTNSSPSIVATPAQ